MIVKDLAKAQSIAVRDGFGEALIELGQKNPQVVVLSADLTSSVKAGDFAKKYPQRFIQVGVAEQNMMGIAAGLAKAGKIPFVTSFAAFSPGRNWTQLRVSVCYQKANVKIAGSHVGVTVGADGATHQALEDVAITRVLPNLTVIAPCDSLQTKKATLAAAKHQGPVYIRFNRQSSPVVTKEATEFAIGKAQVFLKGTDVTIVSCGILTYQALIAAQMLEKENIRAEIINNHTIKPLDTDTILKSVKKTHCLVTVEEHQKAAGMGSAIVENLAQIYAAPVTEMVAVNDSFGESGKEDELLKKYHLDADAIIKAVKKAISRKKRL